MSMTAALGSAGNGVTFTWRGNLYTLMPITLAQEQAFEDWMKAQGRQEVLAMKEILDQADFRAVAAEFTTIAATKYTFWGEEGIKARKTPRGTIKMVQLMLSVKHRGVSEQTVMDMLTEEGEAINLAVADFFQKASPSVETTETTSLDVLTPEQMNSMMTKT